MQTVKGYVIPTVVAVVVFSLGLVPYCSAATQLRAGLYYGSLFFAVLLGASITLLLYVTPSSTTDKEQRDYRFVHFALRLALAFGIGAVVIGVLLVASQLGLMPLF